MSKKSRLRALKAQQIEEQKRLEAEEKLEKAEAKKGAQSKSAKKYIRSAKRKEPKVYPILKMLMLIPYAVNCVFFGGVTVIAILLQGVNDVEPITAYEIIIAIAVIALGLVFEFLRRYILGFIFCSAGSGLFLSVGAGFVSKIQYYMDNYYIDPSKQKMDIEYMWRFYPAALILAFSAALMIITVIRKIMKRRKEKERYNNQPVKSIID